MEDNWRASRPLSRWGADVFSSTLTHSKPYHTEGKKARRRFQTKIRELRERIGMTGAELARRAGVSPPAVTQWENGSRTPATDKLPVIAAVLGCEVSELYEEDALREAARAAEKRKET